MLSALVNLQLGGHLAAQLGLGQHALDRLFDDCLRPPCKQLDERLLAQATGKSGVTAIELGLGLEAGEDDLFRVDDHNVIAHVDVWRIKRVPLARKNAGGLRGEAAKRLTAGIDHKPLTLNIFAAGNGGGHCSVYSLVLPSS